MHKSKLTAAFLASVSAALALSLGLPAHGADTDKDKKKQETVSAPFQKPLKAAQDDLKANKFPEALAELDKARALPKPTPYDTHVINELGLYAYAKTNDLADAAKALEATIDDGFTPAEEATKDTKELAILYYQLKNWDKAASWGTRALKTGLDDDNMHVLVSQAYYFKGDYQDTYKATDDYVNEQIKKGEIPKEQTLELLVSACVKMNDAACLNQALETRVMYYPKPEYWRDIVDQLLQSRKAVGSDVDLLNIYRLANDVNGMSSPDQYLEMAQLALQQGSPGEAEQVLEKGFGKAVLSSEHDRDEGQHMLASAKKQAATDQASLAKLQEDAAAAATGDKAVALGIAYLSYNQYDKAADMLGQGLMKGSVRNEAQARLLLGVAQLKAGKKDDALKTFQMVKGDPTLVRLADLWSVHARAEDHALASG
ncbi:MAG TPA: tetratricopeptide repeat protein [Steroidobacteraceae bacterium]|nr:tetratricopeptide repeat protein [Steroidobacteraceae bacterium]